MSKGFIAFAVLLWGPYMLLSSQVSLTPLPRILLTCLPYAILGVGLGVGLLSAPVILWLVPPVSAPPCRKNSSPIFLCLSSLNDLVWTGGLWLLMYDPEGFLMNETFPFRVACSQTQVHTRFLSSDSLYSIWLSSSWRSELEANVAHPLCGQLHLKEQGSVPAFNSVFRPCSLFSGHTGPRFKVMLVGTGILREMGKITFH